MSVRSTVDHLLRKMEHDFEVHNRIEVSRSALLHNLDLLIKLSGQKVIPVLKGNAYGHGIEVVARALKERELPYIAVDGYFEALRIRKVSSQPVLIMGAVRPENFARLKYDSFAFVVQDEIAIKALGATGRRIAIHLECNTGMNRYGVKPDGVAHLVRCALRYKNIQVEGLMSHLADADGKNPSTIERAVAQFDDVVEVVRALGANPSCIHIAQTGGSVAAHSRYANTMRLGIGLYGINPFSPEHSLYSKLRGLRPSLKFIGTITKVIDLKKGDRVSYNYTFTAPKDMTIGILPAGYYEGINRALSNVGEVKIGGHFVPIIGRVCMNHTMISLEGVKANVGDEVVIYSNDPKDRNSIDAIAVKYGLFNYNVLTALSPDVRRILVK